MDNVRFDRWAKTLSRTRSRRGVLAGLTGAFVALSSQRRSSAQISAPGGMCGGIAGFPCPDGFECVDDPSDSCDPRTGGADCGGMCVKAETCGDAQCGPGFVCCNPVMGICTKPGMVCIQ